MDVYGTIVYSRRHTTILHFFIVIATVKNNISLPVLVLSLNPLSVYFVDVIDHRLCFCVDVCLRSRFIVFSN